MSGLGGRRSAKSSPPRRSSVKARSGLGRDSAARFSPRGFDADGARMRGLLADGGRPIGTIEVNGVVHQIVSISVSRPKSGYGELHTIHEPKFPLKDIEKPVKLKLKRCKLVVENLGFIMPGVPVLPIYDADEPRARGSRCGEEGRP